MLQLGNDPNFRAKSLLKTRILLGIQRQNLDRDRAAHVHMLGLENHSHSPHTQAIENTIVAQDQPVGLARLDPVGLIVGQEAVLDQQGEKLPRSRTLANFVLGLIRQALEIFRQDEGGAK